MSIASLLQYRGGVRSLGKKTLNDGSDHELFYKVRSPAEVAACTGFISSQETSETGSPMLDAYLARFLSAAMCERDGTQLLTVEQALGIPDTLKMTLAGEILAGSRKLDPEKGKD